MIFAVFFQFGKDEAKIAELRPIHRQYLASLRDQGMLAISGPFMDGSGALLVYNADAREQVEAMIQADPFTPSGCFVSWTIHPWNVVFTNKSLLPG